MSSVCLKDGLDLGEDHKSKICFVNILAISTYKTEKLFIRLGLFCHTRWSLPIWHGPL